MSLVKKLGCFVLALLVAVTTLFSNVACENTVVMADEVVYSSEAELYSAMRKIFKEKQKGSYKFEVTEELLKTVCTYNEGHRTYTFDFRNIFYFYSDQTNIAASEGDYLEQQRYWNISTGVNEYASTIEIDTSGTKYCNTLDQEAAFESKLQSLFASGGALAHIKSLSASEKVVACMEYINKNVASISSYEALRHTAYSALCEGQATCQGKALLLYRMLREVGIANRILMGTDAAAHTYNIVLIDGKYYYCDPSTTTVILKGSNSFSPATLQEHYQTDKFKANILSKISATDYPYTPAGGGNTSSGGGNTGGSSNNGGSAQTPTHSHDFSTEYTSDETNHWYACNDGCGEVFGKEAHVAGDWVVDKAATAEEAGNQSKSCTKCGYVMETQEIEKLILTEYKVLDGAESTYKGDEEEFALRAEGEFEKFVNVEVDGKVVEEKYYTVTQGSTIITFTKEFMDMLSEGEHVVKFNFTDGYANANITVATAEDSTGEDNLNEESTQSSDDASVKNGGGWIVWLILGIVVVGAGVAGAIVVWKRKSYCSEVS